MLRSTAGVKADDLVHNQTVVQVEGIRTEYYIRQVNNSSLFIKFFFYKS